MYAILGMELFQNRIKMLGYSNGTANETESFCGDERLKNSEYYNEHYCGDNFNNILKSFKILFDLLVVNQWHSILLIILKEKRVLIASGNHTNIEF